MHWFDYIMIGTLLEFRRNRRTCPSAPSHPNLGQWQVLCGWLLRWVLFVCFRIPESFLGFVCQGSYRSWKTWKVPESYFDIPRTGKWLQFLESLGNLLNPSNKVFRIYVVRNECRELYVSKENWFWNLGNERV